MGTRSATLLFHLLEKKKKAQKSQHRSHLPKRAQGAWQLFGWEGCFGARRAGARGARSAAAQRAAGMRRHHSSLREGDRQAQRSPSPLLREEISISLQIFYYFFFLNPLQIQLVTKYRNSCSHTKRASPRSCSFAICSALKIS